jgi:hypothetical protein
MRDLPLHQASRIGSFAADIVASGGEADVIAVFERSFYLLCPKGIVAICLEDLGCGPINILLPARGGAPSWQGLVRDGMKATISATRLTIHGGFTLSLDQATRWSSPPWVAFDKRLTAIGLHVIQHAWPAPRAAPITSPFTKADEPGTVPGARPEHPSSPRRREDWNVADGLAPLLFAPHTLAAKTPTAIAAKALVATLQNDLPKVLARQTWTPDALRVATLLIGLGPGLTPSGDDLLGGLMLALAARHELTIRDALFDHIVDELNDLTVPVSAMHLTAAAHGQGHEAMHALLNSILAGDEVAIPACLDAVAEIGATSGLDAIAGAVIGLSA